MPKRAVVASAISGTAFNPALGAVTTSRTSELTVFVHSSLVELRCPYRDVDEAVPVGSFVADPDRAQTLGGRTLERP